MAFLSRTPTRAAPGPKGDLLLGHYTAMRDDPLGFFVHVMRAYGDIARFRLGVLTAHLVCHPEQIRQVLQDDGTRWSKKSRGYYKLKLVLGDGLLTSEGAHWKRHRRIAQPAFHRERVAALATVMTQTTEHLLERWAGFARAGAPVDVAAEMMRLTLLIAGRALMGVDLTERAEAFGAALDLAAHDTFARILSPLDAPLGIPTARNVKLRRAIRILDDVVQSIIETRRREGRGDRVDLLSMLMEARDEETGGGLDDQELRDEVMTMLLAGHETTANALTWTWHLLAQSPSVRQKLLAELRAQLAGRTPTMTDLPRLPYTKMVLEESMRLFPPAWVIGRTPVRDEQIAGYDVPAGSIVFVSPYATHRHAAFWPNPDDFDPERFLPSRAAAREKFVYLPFGAGPRICIGQAFAMTEMHLVLATIAQHYDLATLPGQPAIPEPLVTIRTKNGLWMTIHRRDAAELPEVARAAG